MKLYVSALLGLLVLVMAGCEPDTTYTKKPGNYPGDPAQDNAPVLSADKENYRNIALNRMTIHSSSYDYNLTGQLVSDGIKSATPPSWINVSCHKGDLQKREKEWLFDGKPDSKYRMSGEEVFIQLELSGSVPVVTSMELIGSVTYNKEKAGNYQVALYASMDGESWELIKKEQGWGFPGTEKPNPYAQWAHLLKPAAPQGPQPSFTFSYAPPASERNIRQSYPFNEPVQYRFYKVAFRVPGAKDWAFSDWDFYRKSQLLVITPSIDFKSAWMSAGTGREWLMVDFGAPSVIDSVALHWINKAVAGTIEVSGDKEKWDVVAQLPGTDDSVDIITLDTPARGRYLKVNMESSANGKRYIMSELEAFGTGALRAVPKPRELPTPDRITLNGGDWRLQRLSLVPEKGYVISRKDYQGAETWPIATVPGTVLSSYLNMGALPDPNYGDNQLQISESFFREDFWYRTEFFVPEDFKKDELFLHFDGINWVAVVFLNGERIGRINGAFTRAKFNITNKIIPGASNVLAVTIIDNRNFGAVKEQNAVSPDQNGGVLGADNPTFHASVGWDWIPTIRGRNMGIWNDVFLTTTGSVSIEDPFVQTFLPLPDTTRATIRIEATLQNHKEIFLLGTLEGSYGHIPFNLEVGLEPGEIRTVSTEISLENPRLWWPKGYGAPNLYPVDMTFNIGGTVSDSLSFLSGVRQVDFDENNGILSLYINGRRFIGRGGNWGFSESNLNYRAREYDIAVAYHADMNFTMIRNWVGQTGDDEFYEACDRHGIMVWQDFWLANPWDGPDPVSTRMFMQNANDLVRRIRNHPCIALYVGRNEGYPPKELDDALREMIPQLHPGIHYISHSSEGVVSGGGPYRALPVRDYYLLYGKDRMHSERGMPNVMNYESILQTIPEEHLWPHNDMWGLHDFCLEGAQGAASYLEMVEKAFGPSENAEQFSQYAQWINYDGYRGIFEGRSEFRRGMLLWMSHPAWPSMVWQTYDYFFDPTAAYFGCKKASEPLHIQWNPVYHDIEVVNLHAGLHEGIRAHAQIINTDGSVQWEKDTLVNSNEDSTVKCFGLEFPQTLSDVHFIKLTLYGNDRILSENFYWRGLEEGNLKALHNLPKVSLDSKTKREKAGDQWKLTTTLVNTSETPCLMVRLKVTGNKNGERILPVFFSDNYVSLMPGESRTITMTLKNQDTRGEKPIVALSGFNYEE
ncbi:MAG TPA: discoidin domain-containing protein [Bacteroidales bacterium]|nr:discoidin domain-containing protein [Bacteroidales bacterium]